MPVIFRRKIKVQTPEEFKPIIVTEVYERSNNELKRNIYMYCNFCESPYKSIFIASHIIRFHYSHLNNIEKNFMKEKYIQCIKNHVLFNK